MGTISWSPMMNVGVPALDSDHRTLVGLVNDLHRSLGDAEEYATLGSVLQALGEYAQHHFIREERVMEVCFYPSLDAHRRMHAHLFQQVLDLQAAYDRDRTALRAKDCLNFLHHWLIEHICSTDMDYRSWVVGHEAALSAADTVTLTGGRVSDNLDWRRLRVLVVDDNPNFAQIMRTILEGVGVGTIASAADLTAARTRLQGADFDIVITDWHVGQENGLELVAWIRHQSALVHLPVLVLSGHEAVSGRVIALGQGADEFMEKPISARGLLICLSRLLRKDRAR